MHLIASCSLTKYVPPSKTLLKHNKIIIKGDGISKDEISSLIRQQSNTEVLKVKLDLIIFNSIDSAKIAEKRIRKNIELRQANHRKLVEQDKMNTDRIAHARKRGKTHYTQKVITLFDTLEPSMFFREWFKYKIGERPVMFDSTHFNKTIEQLHIYMKKKGFYYANVTGSVEYVKRRKANVTYTIETGPRYMIDSVYIDSVEIPCTNDALLAYFKLFLENPDNSLVGKPFDIDYLEEYRTKLARFMKDQALYGYSPSHFTYLVYTEDMNKEKMTVKLGFQLADRMVPSPLDHKVLIKKKYQVTYVKDVYFHVLDTTLFKGNFKLAAQEKGASLDGVYLPTLDTLCYKVIKKKNSEDLDSGRIVYILYNGELILEPKLIEVQSLVEKNFILTETNLESTQYRLQQMGLFQTVKSEIVEIPESNKVDVHYYLIPNKKESFGFQPRLTTSNGYLGLTAGLNYSNNNMFRGAERFTFGINGGFQAQPAIFDDKIDPTNIKAVTNKFYQFEIGPSIKMELPGLFPIEKTKTNKYRLAKTVISTAYSFQNRDVFSKKIFQMNYLWKYAVGKTQTFQMGLPLVSVIKFVKIHKTTDFESKLNALNDVFLRNTYSNQFIWQDWKLTFEYRDNNTISKKRNSSFYFNSSFDLAGNMLALFKKYQAQDATTGQYKVFGLAYSQFVRLDNEVIYSYPLLKGKSLNFRGLAGSGITYGNSKTSMPYDYSFYAGGSNDVRGWRARALGPGSYKYYLDTARTAIQVGDIRLSGSIEYRFQFSKLLKSAFFLDGGNIWTLRDDANRLGSKFTGNWYKEIALSTGMGFRFDFDYFLIRFDVGIPIHNPALPTGERWIFEKHPTYHQEVTNFLTLNNTPIHPMSANALSKIGGNLFKPSISFGIGYPF